MHLKKKLVSILRNTNLLQMVDHLLLLGNIYKNKSSNKLFLKSNPSFVPPPYSLAYDAYNHTNWQSYYDVGIIHARLISNLIKKHIDKNEIEVCEWGCGPARVIRHLSDIKEFAKVELYGTDYNTKSIEWCVDSISHINFSKNELSPPLLYESDKFDCVYAFSIFTHLSEEKHYEWIKELFRVLKPGGILIFTTHGNKCSERLLPSEKQIFDSGNIVVKGKIEEGKKHFVTHQPHKFVEKLLKDYSIVQHIANSEDYSMEQEIWVAKK